jgi:hypothetical protein
VGRIPDEYNDINPDWVVGLGFSALSALEDVRPVCSFAIPLTRSTLGQPFGDGYTERKGTYPFFKHSTSGHVSSLTLNEKGQENMFRKHLRQFILDWKPI